MKEPTEIWKALDAEKIAEELIPKYHSHLLGAQILFLFSNKLSKHRGKLVLGKASKLSDMEAYLSSGLRSVAEGADFKIVFAHEPWQALSEAQRQALVDHELAHFGWVEGESDDDEGHFALRPHDVEEFSEIVQRHGLWQKNLEVMDGVIQRLSLLEEPDA